MTETTTSTRPTPSWGDLVFGLTLGILINLPAIGASKESYHTEPGKGLPFPHRKLANVSFVAFDTETTGVNPKKDRIVEIGAVKYQDGKIVEEKSWLVNPEGKVPWWAEKVHGISTDMVKDEPVFKKVYPEFLEFIDGSVLIAHNAQFDISFITEELKRSRMKLPPNRVIDSLDLFRKWYPDLESYSLSKVAEHAKIKSDVFHRALADSVYVAKIFNKKAKKLGAEATLGDVYADAGGPLDFD
jgi:DNA polymerase III epsilon subunit family exonuclease